MRERQALVLTAILFAGAIFVAAPAMGIGANVLSDSQDVDNESAAPNESNLGAQVSSFAQASAADANGSVDTTMWGAALNESDDPEDEVDNRTDALLDRLERLENRSAELEAMLENGTINERAYEARASAIRTQIENVRYAINHTEETANRTGVAVNETKLNQLRNHASNMTGPEVSALARNITDAPRGPSGDQGPPDDRGPDGNESDGGPPDNATDGNGTDPGPPDDVGPGNDTGNEDDPPDDGGSSEDDSTADATRVVIQQAASIAARA